MKPTLDEIALTTNTDKSTRFHAYTPVYDALFAHLRSSLVRVLEIGILGGDSLRMWAQYFDNPMSTIVGVDIHDRGFQSDDKRITTIYGDAGNADFLESLPGPFTIVIEDGSHMASHQITAFDVLWKHVAPGGFFCTEDVHVVHSAVHRDCGRTILEHYGRVAELMQDPLGADGCAAYNAQHPFSDIESITLRKGLAIAQKRA